MMFHKFIAFDQTENWLADVISIYCCQFSVEKYGDKLFGDYRIYFPPTLEKAVNKRKAEFLAGRHCARKSLEPFCDTVVDIHIGSHRNPLWPPKIVGSISHNNSYAIAVTALKSNIRGIGIDIEQEINAETYEKIKSQILLDKENEVFSRLEKNLSELTLFTIVFSAKESFFKAAFPEVGKYFDFSSVSVLFIDQEKRTLLMRINETLSDKLTKGRNVWARYRMLTEETVVTLVVLDQE